MKVVSLNPANVVGPYDANTWGRIFFMLRDKALPAVSSGVMSITHVHDVVRAHLSAVSQGKNGERYILAGEDHCVAEFVAEFARLSGTKTPRVAPAWVLKIFGRVSVMVAAITGKEPDVTPEIAAITSQTETVFCSDKAIRELGYRVQPMAVAVQDNYDWLVKEGFLPKAD
jgi:nucleoside-diphosphate-sugar epimerase